jgi:Leucine-rich repeat (LRR) protein
MLQDSSISNLEGIQNFINIEILRCNNNNLETLDLSALINLKTLNCGFNQLTSLNIINSSNLELLDFRTNQLSNINLTGNVNLFELYALNNNLASLNVSGFNNLQFLDCSNNNISALNLTGVSNLFDLKCKNNQLTSLNVSGSTNISILNCSYNQIVTLDATALININNIDCSFNALTALNVNGLTMLETLNCNYNILPNISLTGLSSLVYFYGSWNEFNNININGLPQLATLYLDHNQLSTLSITGSPNLSNINCSYNNLTTLNVSGLISIQHLNCDNNQLTNLDLAGLTNLQHLYCRDNQLTNLNCSGLTGLQGLYTRNNLLTSLIIDGLTSLTTIECENNNLTSLNISGLSSIQSLVCDSNQLTNLNVSGLTNLQNLICADNQLTTLDASGLSNLLILSCPANQLTTINVDGLNSLTHLACDNNLLTNLDLSSLHNLQYFSASLNSLTTLNLKNGSLESNVYFGQNPSLNYICCDIGQLTQIQTLISQVGLSNCVFNSYCSFTPGGDYNTITGAMIFDANNNGCNALDLPQPNIKIDVNDGTTQGSTFTNNLGNYSFYAETGSFVITPSVENPAYFTFSPTSTTVPFANDNDNIVNQNFCITPNGVHPDLEIVIAPIVPARPGFDAKYQIVYKNKGNQILSQINGVNFLFNQNLMDFESATTTPSIVGAGSLSWSYSNLLPFESRSIYVTLNINTPTDTTNPVNIGDILQFTTSILPMAGDETTVDNTFLFNQTVVGSYDPNNIICMEGTVVSPSEIGNYLHYVINFENTGTSEAENIVVQTDVNLNDFDINSLQMLATSHNAYIKVVNNVVEFVFENIMLDTGGHGNVLLKIRSKSNLVTGDVVSKKADIFFDYNFPIDTGMANTTFQALSIGEFVTDNSIAVFPNPAVNFVTINSDSAIISIQLYDVQGRLLQTKIENQTEVTFDVSNQLDGVYFFKIQSDTGVKVVKLIKE